MIYHAGEQVRFLRFTSTTPAAAHFQVTDEDGHPVMRQLTVANGGLEQRRKDALIPLFVAPLQPGRYGWRFWDGPQVESGAFRVVAAPPTPAPARPPEVPTRRYRGPGAR